MAITWKWVAFAALGSDHRDSSGDRDDRRNRRQRDAGGTDHELRGAHAVHRPGRVLGRQNNVPNAGAQAIVDGRREDGMSGSMKDSRRASVLAVLISVLFAVLGQAGVASAAGQSDLAAVKPPRPSSTT